MLNESEVPVLKKVIVASGNKVAIGNNLLEALQNLLSQNAVDIEIENTDDIEGLMEAIIKANQNLTQSTDNNDWEMMGRDLKRLQELITSLETVKKEEDSKREELEKMTNETQTNNLSSDNNTINDLNVVNE